MAEGVRRLARRIARQSEGVDDARAKRVPDDLESRLVASVAGQADATRVLGSKVLQEAAKLAPCLVGGSADLDPSTKTAIKGAGSIARGQFAGRVFHFGIREHGMGSILNGLALSEWFTPMGSTFLIFSDYMRQSMRLAALMERQVVRVHARLDLPPAATAMRSADRFLRLTQIGGDLLALHHHGAARGELRLLAVLRRTRGPSALALTRQKLPALPAVDPTSIARGGYELVPGGPLTLVATGSEVALAVAAAGERRARVSMPCVERFLQDVRGATRCCRRMPRSCARRRTRGHGDAGRRALHRDRPLRRVGAGGRAGEAVVHGSSVVEREAARSHGCSPARDRGIRGAARLAPASLGGIDADSTIIGFGWPTATPSSRRFRCAAARTSSNSRHLRQLARPEGRRARGRDCMTPPPRRET